MTIGYYGIGKLMDSDDTMIIYEYCCYDLNNDNYKKYMDLYDGVIYVNRNVLVEPSIHIKNRKINGRKHFVEKKIKNDVPFDELIKNGKIQVKNAGGTWVVWPDGIDMMAHRLLDILFNEYQERRTIPDKLVCVY